MKIIVDFDVCQSHGLCTEAAPEVFEIRDDGFLYVLNEEPPDALRSKVEVAARECPTGAIRVEG
jgi:ferredoxin